MRCLILIVGCLLFLGLRPAPPLRAYHISGFAQGTTYHITYYAADSMIKQDEIDRVLTHIDSSLSIYQPYSLISRFNQSEGGIVIDTLLRSVVSKSIEVYQKTSGAFDITVLPLVNAWGVGIKKLNSQPDSATIKAILPCVGTSLIALSDSRLIKKKPCVRIDVNGIAQGYSVDVLSSYLDGRKVSNYLVEIGGELRVKGNNPLTGKSMRIGIEAPQQSEFTDGSFQRIMHLSRGAVTTSGSYRKFYQSGGKTISHLINPKTGYTADNDLISVTVYAQNAITADAYDNALMLMGLTKAKAFAEASHEIEAFFIYRKPDGTVADTATTGFYRLLEQPKT
ncbi:FAD:protein FMN transferase [Mucilaginibacter sp. Bleaf8]|uniref:FAD:protein FMN transferase n=1 Tax=Mucilaginibacter sp. Bleaf8 TaxID=2834430 RepID=UPI001BCDE652|nr:FAD:protein FMN transferase [Mucilaginibacter sp. Bleaf8]MBS7562802.1 FAD:protein FMN transferase [Mucilaginibacter sp. Bleaf8]